MARKKQNPEYFTVQEVADRFRVCRHTVYAWIRAGRLGAVRPGLKKWLVSQDHLDAFVRPPRGAPSLPERSSPQRGRGASAPPVPQSVQPVPRVAVPVGFDLRDAVEEGYWDDEASLDEVVGEGLADLGRFGDVGEQFERFERFEVEPGRSGSSLPPARLSPSSKKKTGGRRK